MMTYKINVKKKNWKYPFQLSRLILLTIEILDSLIKKNICFSPTKKNVYP